MEAVRHIIDSKLLCNIISLPEGFQNRKVEVIIFPSNEVTKAATIPKLLTIESIDAMLPGSVTESLIGALTDSGKAIEDYRFERLKKYESAY